MCFWVWPVFVIILLRGYYLFSYRSSILLTINNHQETFQVFVACVALRSDDHTQIAKITLEGRVPQQSQCIIGSMQYGAKYSKQCRDKVTSGRPVWDISLAAILPGVSLNVSCQMTFFCQYECVPWRQSSQTSTQKNLIVDILGNQCGVKDIIRWKHAPISAYDKTFLKS